MDRRYRAAREGKWYKRFDQQTMVATVEHYDDEGLEVEYEFPCKFEVCGTCEGRGSHVNPSIDAHGITPEEFREDPDFEEAYFSGRYDVPCYECGGSRVVPVTDEDRLSPEQKKVLEEVREARAEAARESYEDAYTRRMESGW